MNRFAMPIAVLLVLMSISILEAYEVLHCGLYSISYNKYEVFDISAEAGDHIFGLLVIRKRDIADLYFFDHENLELFKDNEPYESIARNKELKDRHVFQHFIADETDESLSLVVSTKGGFLKYGDASFAIIIFKATDDEEVSLLMDFFHDLERLSKYYSQWLH